MASIRGVLLSVLACTFIFSGHVSADLLGKFVFKDEHKGNSALLSVLQKPHSVAFAPNAGPISSDEISSVLSLSMGLSVHKDLKWMGLQVGSLFNKPRAVMMVTVDGVPNGERLKLSSTDQFQVKMVNDASSSDIYTMSSTSSIASHVSKVFDGESTTLSASCDEEIAASGFSYGKKSTTSFWNTMSNSWQEITGENEIKDSLSRHNILKRISSILPQDFAYNDEEQVVTVNGKGLQMSFNLENKADFNFFSELVYMMWKYEELNSNRAGVKDAASDVYLFTVSTLKGIEHQYGADSKQMQGAMLLLEKFIPQLVKGFSDLYGGDILVVGLTIPSEISFMKDNNIDLKHVVKSLKEDAIKHLREVGTHIPELHVVSELEHAARRKLCESIQGSILQFGSLLKFKCANHEEVHRVSKRSLLATDDVSTEDRINLASEYDEMFPVIFNIWFWLFVILVLAVYVISLSMWYMDPGRDSIIYRLTQQRIKSD